MKQRPFRGLLVVGSIVTTLTFSVNAALITSVVETGGDTDRPSAKFTGQTFNVENPTGTVLIPNYTVPTFGEDVLALTDRTHQYNGITNLSGVLVGLPSYLVGGEYVLIANNDRDNIPYSVQVTVAQPVTVYLLIDNRGGGNDNNSADPPGLGTSTNQLGQPFMQWVLNDGYTPVATGVNRQGNPAAPDEVGVDEAGDGTLNNFSSVYARTFAAGTFTINEFGLGGRNMYGAVVTVVPEPHAAAMVGLGLFGLWLLVLRRKR